MAMTLTEQIEEALREGRLSFMEVREICDLWNQRNKLDGVGVLLPSDPGYGEGFKKIEKLTSKIEAIINKSKLSISERLESIEKARS